MNRRSKAKGFAKDKVLYFNSGFLENVEFNADAENSIVKKALVLVEGTHVDSNKRTHTFTPDRIKKIVNNTNDFLKKTRVAVLKDHKKLQDSTIGDVEGRFEAKIITEEDLPHPKYRELVGKLGAFATEVVIKGKQAVEDVASGLITTISPGIDVTTDIIKEISATPIPAIPGMSLFSRRNADFALTWEEAEMDGSNTDAIREAATGLLEEFLGIIEGINNAGEDELEGQTPEELQAGAVEGFVARLNELIGFDPENQPLSEEEEMQLNQLQMRQALQRGGIPGGQDPNYLKQQQGIRANMNRYGKPEAKFSFADLGSANFGRGKDRAPRKKRTGMIAAGATAGAVGLGAAGRYGTSAVRGAIAARKLKGQVSVARGAKVGAQTALRNDLGRLRAVGSGAKSLAKKVPGSGRAAAGARRAGSAVGGAAKRVFNFAKRAK